jgi:hypothetical protein
LSDPLKGETKQQAKQEAARNTTDDRMWQAIKHDLFDFVNTISEDTTKTISKVIGESKEEVYWADFSAGPISPFFPESNSQHTGDLLLNPEYI